MRAAAPQTAALAADPTVICAALPVDDCARLARAAILALPVERRARLAPLFAPAALAQARKAERDALLAQIAMGQRADDVLAAARAVYAELNRYALGRWRFDRDRAAPRDPRDEIVHRIMSLSDGNVLSVSRLRSIFGAKLCSKKPQETGTDAA